MIPKCKTDSDTKHPTLPISPRLEILPFNNIPPITTPINIENQILRYCESDYPGPWLSKTAQSRFVWFCTTPKFRFRNLSTDDLNKSKNRSAHPWRLSNMQTTVGNITINQFFLWCRCTWNVQCSTMQSPTTDVKFLYFYILLVAKSGSSQLIDDET